MEMYLSINGKVRKINSNDTDCIDRIVINHIKKSKSKSFPKIYLLIIDDNGYSTLYVGNSDFEYEEASIFDNSIFPIFKPILKPKSIPNILYHKAPPTFRENIIKEGLIPQVGETYSLHYEEYTEDLVPLVFLSTNMEYDSTYDDDLYKIDTTNLNKDLFVIDIDVLDAMAYLEAIPVSVIELIHKGSGKSL